MVLYLKSSAYFAGPLRPCGRPALARALPLALGLALALALALAVALALLRALALPLVFALASASFFAPPEEPKSTPGGGQNGLLEASGGLLGPRTAPSGRQGRSGAAPGRLLESSWRLLELSWSALGASWSRLGVPGRSPEGAREALLGGIFGGLYRISVFGVFRARPERTENETKNSTENNTKKQVKANAKVTTTSNRK